MDYKSIQMDVKSLTEDGTFEGRLSVYGVTDEGNEIVERGAFQKTLQESGASVPLLWQHDHKTPIGVLALTDTPNALMARGKLVLAVPKAMEAYHLLKAGALRGLSIGYRAIKSIPGDDGIKRLRELRLYEGSLVSVGMNLSATVTGVKNFDAEIFVDDAETLDAFKAAARELREFATRMKG